MNHLNRNSEKGFSLIEMAILLIIAGLFTVPLSIAYTNYVHSRISDSMARMSTIAGSHGLLDSYISASDPYHYPVPADLFLKPGDAQYGMAYSSAGAIGDCTGWPTASGICRFGSGANAVLIGGLPFATMGISPDYGYDYWGHKFLYAVMESQTISYSSSSSLSISFIGYSSSGALVSLPDGGATKFYDAVLVSMGKNGEGAYNHDGELVAPCAGATPVLEDENCDMDNIFVARDNGEDPNPITSVSDVIGPDYFDDYLVAKVGVYKDLWEQSQVADYTNFTVSDAQRIGIGTADPQAMVHVMGSVQADEVDADSICNNASDCFDPEIITGSVPDMTHCHTDSYGNVLDIPVVALDAGKLKCASGVDSGYNPLQDAVFLLPSSSFTYYTCPTGQMMDGLDSSGKPTCSN